MRPAANRERLSTIVTSREIRLRSHPVGMPTSDNFELATVLLSDPRPGEVQVKNLWMSVARIAALRDAWGR